MFAEPYLRDHFGGAFSLDSLSGVAHAFVFLPGAFTPVCTAEIGELDGYAKQLANEGMPVFGISCDSPQVLNHWREQTGIALPLLSDFWPHGEFSRAFNAFNEEDGRSRRVSLVRGPHGCVTWRDEAPLSEARNMARLASALRAVAE
ncbi:redoxin domain-containing protein [Dermabacteraceae bacterium P9123]